MRGGVKRTVQVILLLAIVFVAGYGGYRVARKRWAYETAVSKVRSVSPELRRYVESAKDLSGGAAAYRELAKCKPALRDARDVLLAAGVREPPTKAEGKVAGSDQILLSRLNSMLGALDHIEENPEKIGSPRTEAGLYIVGDLLLKSIPAP